MIRMNKTKLTLSIQPNLLEKAKVWAHQQGISLSEAISRFLAEKVNESQSHSPGIAESLKGIAEGSLSGNSDKEIRTMLHKRQRRK